jgi:hypothetical protein
MKTSIKILLLFTISTLIYSCSVGKRSTITQLSSNSLLHFVTDNPVFLESNWAITIDESEVPTIIKVDKNNSRFSNDTTYEISNGTHTINVFRNQKFYTSKKVFIGSGETKTIKL